MRAGFILAAMLAAAALGRPLSTAQTLSGSSLQTPPTQHSQKLYTITGTVINSASGEPLRRALVRWNGAQQAAVFTGADGRFRFENVPEGSVFLSAEKPGFLDPNSLIHFGNMGPLTVGPGKTDFTLQLTPCASIAGRVLDNDGEPLEGVEVDALAEQIVDGHNQWLTIGSAATDDTGTYRIENVAPGHFLIRTGLHAALPPGWNAPTQVYGMRYYPNSPELSSAERLSLEPGREDRADFTLRPEPAFSISGTVLGIPTNTGFGLSIETPDGQQIAPPEFRVDPNKGTINVGGLPAGSYTLELTAIDQGGNSHSARETFDLNGSDVRNLQLVLQPPAVIPVVVNHAPLLAPAASSAGQAINNTGFIQLQLIDSKTNRSYNGNSTANGNPQAGDSSQFEIQNVQPGSYKVLAQTSGPECIDSVSSGPTDLSRDPFTIAPGSPPQPITVNLRKDCATATVTIHSDTQANQAILVLLPQSFPAEPQIFSIMGRSFSFSGLRPGEYRLYAFSSLNGLEYANPDALRDFPCQTVELDANQNANITLDLIVREPR